MRDNIGEFIKEQRIKNKISQNKLAEILFIDRTLISKWENGKATPCMNEIVKMAELFNISIEEFVSGEIYTKSNKEEIKTNFNNYLISQDNKLNIFKKRLTYSLFVILLTVLSFFIYYFYNTYDKIIVYRIIGETDNYSLNRGILLLARNKSYFQFNYDNQDIKEIEIYYKNKDNRTLIYKGDPNSIKFDNNGYDSSINLSNFNKIKDEIYMDIYDKDDNIFTMKLSFVRDFINDKIVFKEEENVIDNEYKKDNNNIPIYIKNNFNCNENICSYIEDNIQTKYDYKLNVIYLIDGNKLITYFSNKKVFWYEENNKLIKFKDGLVDQKYLKQYNHYMKYINKYLEKESE